MSVLKTILSYMTTVIVSFTAIICPTPESNDTAEIINEFSYGLVDAFVTGQGLDEADGYFYSSGSLAAIKLCCLGIIDKNSGEIIKQNIDALPNEFKQKTYDHIGDISVQDGIIYAPVENEAETDPLVLLFDAETLEYTGTYYAIDWTYLKDGIPWCATDENYLYTSEFNNAERIVVYNIDDMSFSHTVELSDAVQRVQAGDAYDGRLYLNCDPKEGNKTVYEVDLTTGEVTLLCDRNTTGFETETEGMCISRNAADELILNVADYNKIVSTFIRTYKVK